MSRTTLDGFPGWRSVFGKTDPQQTNLRPSGGRKLALQNGKVEGSEVGKNTALFLEAVKE